MQIELWFGDSAVMLADEFPEAGILSPVAIGGTPVILHFSTENVEALWKRTVDAGATVLQPLQDQFWGDRYGLAQHIRDVSSEEIARQAANVFGGQG